MLIEQNWLFLFFSIFLVSRGTFWAFPLVTSAKAQEIDLEWNGTNYSATLTDTNNVLGNFTFSADASGISFSVSGNKLTITADKAPSGTVGITDTKTGSVRKGVIIWTDGVYAPGQGQQDLSTYAAEVNDPVRGYLNIAVSLGAAKIVKTSEDGNVSGTPVRYVVPESQTTDIVWNKVTEKFFENILKKWRADVFKLDAELANGNGSTGVPVKVLSADSDEMLKDLGGAYGQTQGDATLAGAVYGVYKGEECMHNASK